MKQLKVVVLLGFLFGLIAAFTRNVQAGALNLGAIMPVGDSITYGLRGSDAGYRGPLYDLLTTAGANFQFVGTSTSNPGNLPASQQGHDGWGGWATSDILGTAPPNVFNDGTSGNINTWLDSLSASGKTPSIVTMMIGTNDYSVRGMTLTQGIGNLSSIIDTIYTDDPSVKLMLATLTPRFDGAVYSNWVDIYNGQLAGLVDAKNKAGDHIVLVDMNTRFPSNGLSDDNVHPNDIGYAWMAGQWKTAIVESAPEPGTMILLAIGLASLLVYAWGKKEVPQ